MDYEDRLARADRLARNPFVGVVVDGIDSLERRAKSFFGVTPARPSWCDECMTRVGDGDCDVCRIQRGEPLDDEGFDEGERR